MMDIVVAIGCVTFAVVPWLLVVAIGLVTFAELWLMVPLLHWRTRRR